jgi:hypothetical protein
VCVYRPAGFNPNERPDTIKRRPAQTHYFCLSTGRFFMAAGKSPPSCTPAISAVFAGRNIFFFIIFLTKIQRRKRAWEMSYGRGKHAGLIKRTSRNQPLGGILFRTVSCFAKFNNAQVKFSKINFMVYFYWFRFQQQIAPCHHVSLTRV